MSGISRLSIARVGHHVPSVPTNTERLATFRAALPPEIGNAFRWKWLTDEAAFAEAYAREQGPCEVIEYEARRGE